MAVTLECATGAGAEMLLTLQKEAFAPLYALYQDEISPFMQDVEYIHRRLAFDNASYWKIYADGMLCGGIYTFKKGEGLYRLGIMNVLPAFQGKGIGRQAIALAEAAVPDALEWELDFPIDQAKNRKCYENAGYMDSGRRVVINERLSLAYMRKYVPPLRLVVPSEAHKAAWEAFRNEFQEAKEKIVPYAARIGDGRFESFLQLTTDFAQGKLPPDMPHLVQASTYFLMDESDEILGCINIRYVLNEYLLQVGGNIGYGVRPLERQRGYATKMLSLALDKCRLLGMKKVLVTCDKNNEGSARTIQKNGGVLENEFKEDNGNLVQRYWIQVSM